MKTVLYKTTQEDIKAAASVVAGGGLVAFPTETVYGLGADAFDANAAKKAYKAKGRPSDNPLIVHIAKYSDLYRLVPKNIIDDKDFIDSTGTVIEKLANAFWPGPMTLVLLKLDEVPLETTGGLASVAVRMPNDTWTLEFIKESGTLISGPSANTSGRPSPTSYQHVMHDLDGKIDGIICGKACEGGIESTVISLMPLIGGENTLKILRPGLITPEMIAEVTGLSVEYDKALLSNPILDANGNALDDPNFHPAAPGMKYKHYAPKADMLLLKDSKKGSADFLERVDEFCKAEEESGKKLAKILPDAKTFYAQLRKADEEGCNLIVAPVLDDDSSISFSVMNRVLKAAGYNVKEI